MSQQHTPKTKTTSLGCSGWNPDFSMRRFIWPNDIGARLRLERSRYVRSPEEACLFVMAPRGFGKTHLLQAIAWDEWHTNPNHKIVYLAASAWNRRQSQELLQALRDIDLLLVDDLEDFRDHEAIASLLQDRSRAGRRTVVSMRDRKAVLQCGLGALFNSRMTIAFGKLSPRQVQRLIEQRARDCGISLTAKTHRRLASYRYRDVMDVMQMVGAPTVTDTAVTGTHH